MNKQRVFFLLAVGLYILFLCGCYKKIDPECPDVRALSPNSGKMGDVITIKGAKFNVEYPTIYSVNIGDTTISSSIRVPNDSTLQFTVPSGKGGKVSVTVKNGCTAGNLDFTYYYTATKLSKLMGAMNSPAGL